FSERDKVYRLRSFTVHGLLSRDGRMEVESIDFENGGLPRGVIAQFLATQRFDVRPIPLAFERWYVGDGFSFRHADDRVARAEKRQEDAERQRALRALASAETIAGVYIPKDLGECFVELDKELSEVDRREMRELPSRDDMIAYHIPFGSQLRNRWGLWAGSRLARYFQ